MTSFGNNFTNTPYMSDLLQKHLQNASAQNGAPKSQNQAIPPFSKPLQTTQGYIQAQNPGINTQAPPQINPQTQNINTNLNPLGADAFVQNSIENQEYDKKSKKRVKLAAASLSAAIVITFATIFCNSKSGKSLIKKATSNINSTINKGLHNLYQSHKSEKLDKAIESYYSMRSNFDFAGLMPNVINGKDVLQRGAVEKLKGKDINLTNAGSFKKKAVEMYQAVANKIFGAYDKYDNATEALYVKKGLGNVSNLYGKAKDAIVKSNDDISSVISNLKNSPKANETILYKGKKVKIKDIIPDIEKMAKNRQDNFDAFFTDDLIKQRYSAWDEFFKNDKAGKSLTEKTQKSFIEKIKGKKIRELLSDSVADELIKGEKSQRASVVRANKAKITNTLNSVLDTNRESVADISKFIQPGDIDSLQKLDETLKTIDKFKKTSFTTPSSSKEAQGSICAAIEELKKSIIKGSRKNGVGSADAIKALENIKKSVNNIESGDTEKLMEVLEQVLEPETYERMVKPGLVKSQKALNKACSVEMYDAVDKLRDINCGSAATDFMTAIMSTGLLGIYTAQAENNDERISVGLTTGLPITATVGTNLFAAVNQISGAKSWALSLGTGFVAKTICDAINKAFRKSKGLDDNAKPSVATIDDYIDPYRDRLENVLKI